MNHLRRLGNSISISIQPDENRLTGRECPQGDCEGYFKIEAGTGLTGEALPCHCPYCGHTAGQDHFWTKEQLAYAKSVAMRKITDAVFADFKALEFDHRPIGGFGIGLSMKVTRDRPTPIHYYREKQLETEVVCVNCTLRYSIYGVFAYCPDCGEHNSVQILDTNLELIVKMLDMAASTEAKIARHLIENALEDCVSAFDGFGREICRIHSSKSPNPAKAQRMSFQNLEGAKQSLRDLFGVDLAAKVSADEWTAAGRGFQKRHLLSHKMGVVDEEYARRVSDAQAVVGRKIGVDPDEVRDLVRVVAKLARGLSTDLPMAGSSRSRTS